MPIYTYTCDKCLNVSEQIVKASERDALMTCEGLALAQSTQGRQDRCGGLLRREGVELFTHGKPSFQPGVVLGNGAKVKGHFGKDARKKGWHRP